MITSCVIKDVSDNGMRYAEHDFSDSDSLIDGDRSTSDGTSSLATSRLYAPSDFSDEADVSDVAPSDCSYESNVSDVVGGTRSSARSSGSSREVSTANPRTSPTFDTDALAQTALPTPVVGTLIKLHVDLQKSHAANGEE